VLSRPLLWVLHLGYAALALGLLLGALPLVGVAIGTSALHLVTVGGIGLLTLGMMARVSLGHTGRPLRVGVPEAIAFLSVGLAAGVRVAGPWISPQATLPWLWVSAALWTLGFLVFVVRYARILLTPRADGKPG
jgi:uncharacterized protein involved in response to NO